MSKPALIGGSKRLTWCWVIAVIWLLSTAATLIWPAIAAAIQAPIPLILLFVFMLVYGSLSYGWKGIGLYFGIGSLAGLVLEASSIATGFPFGFYVHNVPGPRVLEVPIHTIFAYAILGLPAWSLARLIVRPNPLVSRGMDKWTTPIIAAFIMTGVDLAFDPIGATVLHMWTFRHPGGQFGVPISNFLGWIFIGWIIFQSFALLENRFARTQAVEAPNHWWLVCLLWLGQALQYPFMVLNAPPGTASVGDRSFVIADVFEGGLIVALFTVVFSALLGFSRLLSQPPKTWTAE